MKIRMKTLAVGPGVMFHPGKVYEVADVVGEPFVVGNYAVRLDVPAKPKAAPVEDAPKPPRRGRGNR